MKTFKKNSPQWNRDQFFEEIKEFGNLYKNRPIKNNVHGMRFQHMFATYFILKKIKPSFVIESGVYKGQSTWLIENTLPNSKILSIDIDLSQRVYFSQKAQYSNVDFKDQNFSNLPEDTLVFLDDHVNHYERLQQAKFFNIKKIILEDNYPVDKGDFYTINHAMNNEGFNHNYTKLSLLKTFWIIAKNLIKKLYKKKFYFPVNQISFRLRDQLPNKNHFRNIEKNIESYFEFPNIIKHIDDKIDLSKEEKEAYNYITFINLK